MRRSLAARYIDFVTGGGVLLVLSSFQSVGLDPSSVCTAPVALLSAVLGPGRLSNCSCGRVGPGDISARLNSTAAEVVLGRQGVDRLADVQVSSWLADEIGTRGLCLALQTGFMHLLEAPLKHLLAELEAAG